VPWRVVRARMRVELRVTRAAVAIWSLGAEPVLLTTHDRARSRGSWVVDEAHWDGLPALADPAIELVTPVCANDAELMASRSLKAHIAVAPA
jgi:hypothetical protein